MDDVKDASPLTNFTISLYSIEAELSDPTGGQLVVPR